jgi:hypothetical protein
MVEKPSDWKEQLRQRHKQFYAAEFPSSNPEVMREFNRWIMQPWVRAVLMSAEDSEEKMFFKSLKKE